MKIGLYSIAIIISAIIMSGSAFADVKIKSKQTMSGQSYENTTYIKGKRQRSESMNGMMINLTQCDLRRGVQLNSQTKTYMVNSFEQGSQPGSTSTATEDKNGVVQAGGRVTTTISTKDTGERKQMFGFTAKHLLITMETLSSPDACNKTNTKMQTDGWYIDAEFVLDCDYGQQNYGNYGGKTGGCKDKFEMKTIGTAKRGYPVYEKMTMFDESGKEIVSYVNEVVELSKATLEMALFDIPADYREVNDASQMYSTTSSASGSTTSVGSTRGSSTSSMPLPNSTGVGQSVRGASQAASSTGSLAKQAGVIRIGLASVKAGAVGDAINAADLAAAVQNTLTSFLKVPNIEVVNLESRLSSAIAAEAQQKECDYVIYTNVSHKKGGGGGFGMFGQALGSAIGQTGIGHTGSTAGNIAGQIATQSVVSATSVSGNVKSKDEITLDLKLNKADGAAALAKVYKVKAKSNGDDIISHVVEQAAEEIVGLIAN